MTYQNDLLKQDEQDRELIRTNISENYFVEASAGSGKTTALVDRMLALVKQGVTVRQICAITFTKNAAAEFYSRFQKKLSEAAADPALPADVRRLCAEALNEIDLAFMGTIDSFCNLILHEHPVRAQIPGDAEIYDTNDMKPVYAREYAKIVNEEYEDPALPQKAERFAAVFDHAKHLFLEEMDSLMQIRHTNWHYPAPLGTAFAKAHMQEIEDLAADLTMLVEDFEETTKGNAARLCYNPGTKKAQRILEFAPHLRTVCRPEKWNTSPMEIIKALRIMDDYQITAAKTPQENGIRSRDLFAANTIASGAVTFYKIVLKEFPLFRALQSEVVGTAYSFFDAAAEPMAERLRGRGELTYFDNLLYLRDLLRADASDPADPGALIRYITKRHSYFLIDEFQDTNPLQAEIFFYLAAQTPVTDWRQCVPRPGSLFIVGDPKQSIYRFRNADVGSFLNVRRLFEAFDGCRVLTLRQNFRTERTLCGWFNECFKVKMPAQPDPQSDQSVFEEIPADQPYQAQPGSLNGVFTYKMIGDTDLPDADIVCEIIRKLTGDSQFQVQTRSDKAPRPIRYSDFMVITPGKHKFYPYVRTLAEYGIPARVEGELKFSDSPALVSLAAILNAAVNPFRWDAVFRAWTCPLTGLTAEDLLTLQPDGTVRFQSEQIKEMLAQAAERIVKDCGTDAETAEQTVKRLTAFAETMSELTQKAKTIPFTQLMEAAIRLTGLYASAGTDSMEYVCYAQELVRSKMQEGEICSAQEGAAFLIHMVDAPEEERSLALDRNANCVHFANLHKVKGLEAPIVILALPGRGSVRQPGRRTEYAESGAESWFFECNNQRTDQFSAEQDRETQAGEDEKMRLRYVAATRAQCALIIADLRKKTKSKATKDYEYAGTSLWAELAKECRADNSQAIMDLLNDVQIPEKAEDNAPEYAEAAACLTFSAEAKAPGYTVMTPSRLAHAAVSKTKQQDPTVLRETRADAALVGTMVHRLMECVVSAGDTAARDALCADICREFGADPGKYAEKLAQVYDRMQSGGYPQEQITADPEKRTEPDLLQTLRSADEIYCELPFSYCGADGEVWYGVMDLVYLADGAWHIVDYKTNEDGTALDVQYEKQLAAYRAAFRQLTGNDAAVHIYHIEVV